MRKSIAKLALQATLLAAFIGGALYLAHLAKDSAAIQQVVAQYGYAGIYIVSLISGFNLAVPLPAVSFLPLFLESGLSFWASIVLIAAGTTTADTAAYFLGRLGRQMVSTSWVEHALGWIERARKRHAWAPLALLFVVASLVPLPNEIIVMPLGFLGYKLRHIIPIVLVGNFLFNLMYATGILGLARLFA